MARQGRRFAVLVGSVAGVRAKVEEVIEVIRPAVQADGGDLFLRDVDEATGVVTVELTGACVSCPASTVTLKAGIERILKDRVDGVTEVVDLGQEQFEGTPLSL
jgi:Fe-S cluster biogenesis protein NfuA